MINNRAKKNPRFAMARIIGTLFLCGISHYYSMVAQIYS